MEGSIEERTTGLHPRHFCLQLPSETCLHHFPGTSRAYMQRFLEDGARKRVWDHCHVVWTGRGRKGKNCVITIATIVTVLVLYTHHSRYLDIILSLWLPYTCIFTTFPLPPSRLYVSGIGRLVAQSYMESIPLVLWRKRPMTVS